jgi:hypothetical protein
VLIVHGRAIKVHSGVHTCLRTLIADAMIVLQLIVRNALQARLNKKNKQQK